ncbi:MAG: site-specific integrase [Azospirillaceae bacterium]
MASIRKRGSKYQVQVRRHGHPPVSRSFHKLTDARQWARDMETRADLGPLARPSPGERKVLLRDILTRYRDEVTPSKRGHVVERDRLTWMTRHRIAALPLSTLLPSTFSSYRDERLATCSPETVLRELSLLQHVLDIARLEWDLGPAENPVRQIRKPKPNPARERRLSAEEAESLRAAARKSRNSLIAPIVDLAIETGMRRGEILGLRWQDIDLEGRTARLGKTKNGHARSVPLTDRAVTVLETMATADGDAVFPITINAFRLAWHRLVKRAGIEDLHFHDLRHEAISRFFERGLSVPEVALISGHRDYRMLARYTHLRAEDVARKLAGNQAPG